MSDLIRRDDVLEIIKRTSGDYATAFSEISKFPAVDAVEVVRCKDCRWAKSYERCDGEIGFYCHFCGNSFTYGELWERLFTPIKEKDDFCSYGERRDENERV